MSDEHKSWPQLVGVSGEEAANIIKQETGFTNVVIIGENSMVTMDYQTDRVRVRVDANGNVSSPPSTG